MDFFWTRLRHIVWLALPLQAAFAAPPEPRPEPDTGFDIAAGRPEGGKPCRAAGRAIENPP